MASVTSFPLGARTPTHTEDWLGTACKISASYAREMITGSEYHDSLLEMNFSLPLITIVIL